MAADSYSSQASQYVKEIYAPQVVRLYPEANFLTKNITFDKAAKIGKQYVVPIELAPEQGVTYAAASAGAFTLNGAQALTTQDATLTPAQIVVQRAVDYESIQRTVGSKAAFVSFIDATLRSVVALATKRLEISMLWGQYTKGIGTVASLGTYTGAGTAGATMILNMTSAEWSGGLWGGMENAMIQVLYTSLATDYGISSSVKFVQVQSVDLGAQTVTVIDNSTSAATLASVNTNFAANGATLFPYGVVTAAGTPTWSEMAGMALIASNSATYAGINSASYGLWKGNSITSWGAPSIGKILDNMAKLVERGLDEDVVVLISPKHFARLNSDQTALRLYTVAGGTAKNGFNSIELASENGKITVRSHRFMKDGYVLAFPLSKCKRIGSTELTFTNMGVDGDIFLQNSTTASVELRGYLGQSLLCVAPSRCFLGSGVTYP